MNNEIIEELVRQIAALEKRIEYLETVEETAAWIDYSATSTIVGWSSYTTKEIFYKKIGKTMFVQFNIAGVSDSTATTFTVPYNNNTGVSSAVSLARAQNNSAAVDTSSWISMVKNGNIVYCYHDFAAADWAASNNKLVKGSYSYQTA